jgi:hypothetical protein
MANGTWYNKGFGARAEDGGNGGPVGQTKFGKGQTQAGFMGENGNRDFDRDPGYGGNGGDRESRTGSEYSGQGGVRKTREYGEFRKQYFSGIDASLNRDQVVDKFTRKK